MSDASDYGLDASSSSRFTHPTSCTRDEPHQPSSSTTRYDPFNCLIPSPPRYKFLDGYAHYLPQPSYTVTPGLTSQGKLTTAHPIVSLLLSRLHTVSPIEGRIENEKWWTKTFKQWTVNDILDLTDDEGNEVVLTDLQAECIFVLAALRVSNHPMHPKHFTLWGKEWATRTAERVQKVLGQYLVISPHQVPFARVMGVCAAEKHDQSGPAAFMLLSESMNIMLSCLRARLFCSTHSWRVFYEPEPYLTRI
jgi:hypothetical protein